MRYQKPGDYKSGETINLTIGDDYASIITSPKAKDLTYNKTEQQLVTPGSADCGTIWYRVDDGEAHVPSARVGNAVKGDRCRVTAEGAQIKAGEHTATATALSSSNYVLPQTVNQTYIIEKSATIHVVTKGSKWKNYKGIKLINPQNGKYRSISVTVK